MLFLDIILTLISILILLVGVWGYFFPIIPGTIISFIGFGFLHFLTPFKLETPFVSFLLMGFFVLIVSFSDYFFQIIGVKKMGGGKNAIWGVTIGTLIGLILLPTLISIIIGPFIGGGYRFNFRL